MTAPVYTYNHSAQVVSGETCPTGSSSTRGSPSPGGSPRHVQQRPFLRDYSRQCIWAMLPGTNGSPNPNSRQTYVAGARSPVRLVTRPGGDLFYVDLNGGDIHRIQYMTPTAVLATNPTSGRTLTVALDNRARRTPLPGSR